MILRDLMKEIVDICDGEEKATVIAACVTIIAGELVNEDDIATDKVIETLRRSVTAGRKSQ